MSRWRAGIFVYKNIVVKPFCLYLPLTNPNSVTTIAPTSAAASTATNSAVGNLSTFAANMSEEEPKQTTNGLSRTVEENDVGISCYMSQLPGFRGILKQRYSDFIVNEVDLEENIVHLTTMEVSPEMPGNKESDMPKPSDLPNPSDQDYTSEIEAFRSLAGDSDADLLKDLIDKFKSGSADDAPAIVLSSSSDKAHRTALHNFFKDKLKFLVTDTVDGPDTSSKCIRVRVAGGRQNGGNRSSRKRKDRGDNNRPFDRRGSEDWPEHLGKFLRFHLYKENKDTQEALRVIGKMLGVQTRSFGFAGTKDKRAVTTQRVTVFKQQASKMASLNARLFGIKVGNFCHVKEGLLLGQLLGNRFTITLRGVVADAEETIKSSASALGNHGFVNYFGLQRFGSGSMATHLIGAALLRGEWKTAVDMILDPRVGERDGIKSAREYYKESNDIDGTLRQMPHNMVAERTVLQCLKKSPGNYLQALTAIPRTLRMMYVHSYQSYLWNHAASMRAQKYGVEKIILGDLVYSKEGTCQNDAEVHKFEAEAEADCLVDGLNSNNLDVLPDTDLPGARCEKVKVITTEDLQNGIYTVDDVVLPLPGSRVTYPDNDVAILYHDLAKKDNISLTESVHGVKEFSITCMTGGFRRVFQKLKDFKWELLRYTDGNKPLAETDLDMIAMTKPVNIEPPELSDKHCDAPSVSVNCDMDDVKESSISEVTQTALKLCFTLPASCYATMAIRELLKTSTSVAYHKTLNT